MTFNSSSLVLALAQTLVWASLFYLFPAMLLEWEASFGWDRPDLTAAITLAMLVAGISSPMIGRLIDAGKGPVLMTGCTVLGGFALLALSFVTTLLQFYSIWAVMGLVFAGCLYEPCFAMVTRAYGGDAKRTITLITLVAGFASSLSFPIAHLLAESVGWQTAVRIFALVVLAIAAPMMWFGASAMELQGLKREINQRPTNRQRTFLRHQRFWFLAMGFGVLALLHAATLHHLLPILREYGFSSGIAVLVASLIGPMQVAGRIAMMALENRVSNHAITIGCFVLLGLSICSLMLSTALPVLVFVFVTLFGSAYGMVSILRPVVARDVLGESQFGAKTGILAMVYMLGAASAPWLGSLIWSIGTYSMVLPCILGLSVLGLGFYLVARRKTTS